MPLVMELVLVVGEMEVDEVEELEGEVEMEVEVGDEEVVLN